MPAFKRHCNYRNTAFSLIELLAVMAVVSLLMAMLLPSISGWGSTVGRRGAVTLLMNTFEQARVAAIESGQTVYVGFADGNFPVEDMRFAAFIVFRDATDTEKAENPSADYVILKPWTKLPKNIAFATVANSLTKNTPANFSKLPVPQTKNDSEFPTVAFTSSGTIRGGGLVPPLFLYEGFYKNGQDNFTREANGLYERLSFSRYTGRVQLDATGT